MEEEPTEEEINALICMSLREVHMADNRDGTVTMTCTLVIGEDRLESVAVFEANLGLWFSEAVRSQNPTELMEKYLNSGTFIPSSLED